MAVCPLPLTLDLGRPWRFWHMLVDLEGDSIAGIGYHLTWHVLGPMIGWTRGGLLVAAMGSQARS
jgi:hypothetical protein